MNQQRCKILTIFSILFLVSTVYSEAQIRSSCLEHFLNGESSTKVLPISSAEDSKNPGPFYIECIFPTEKESDQKIITKVHSALEKWHRIEPGKRETIGYQISDRKTLKKLIQTSEECSQEVSVQWPALTVLPEGQILGFTIESIEGTQRVFQRNATLEPYTEALVLETVLNGNSHESGSLHILGTDEKQNFENLTAWIKLSPLICQQKIVENVECLSEINEKIDRITLTGISQGFIKFAFRTDKPEGPFLRVTTENGSHIQMDLLDGYLLTVGHVVHPVKLLADGNWHSAKFDVKALTLQIDDSLPIIYLSAINSEKPVTETEILLNGQITAIRAGVSEEWMCTDSTNLKTETTPQILRRICPFYEANYCKCKAPATVLEKQNCGKIDEKKAYQLDRSPSKLGFFFLPNFGEKSKISIVFRSDSDVGLVFFGVANTIKSSTRIQTHFIGNRFFAASCTLNNSDGTEKCRSCSIERDSEGQNEWIRLSFFHYKDYSYLTVDGEICQLTPIQTASAEAHVMDGANLYEVKTTNKSALFIGGTYYSNRVDFRSISKEFRKDFLDNTMEKSPSLRGCIAEIIVNEVHENLEKLYKNQIKLISTNSNSEIFSIDKCQPCRVPIDQCGGAKCRSSSPLLVLPPVCDCSSIYALQEESSGRCLFNSSTSTFKKYGGLTLTTPSATSTSLKGGLILNRTSFVNSGKASLDKIWMLLRLPEINEKEKTIFKMGSIKIKVAENGKKVIILIDESRHEFFIENSADDERLHLIAIKRTPSDSTFNLQVDNQITTSEFFEDSLKGKIDIFIFPIVPNFESESEENVNIAFPGCISELSIGYEFREPTADNRAHLSKSPENRAHSIDLLNMIVSDIQSSGNPFERNLIQKIPCGIRDSSIWTSNSSSYGKIKNYDPNGDSDSSAGLSIFITVFIVLLVLLALILFCYCRQKKFKSYHLNSHQRFKATVGKEEKVPLKGAAYCDTSRSSTDHSHVDLSASSPPLPIKSNGDAPPLQANRVMIHEASLEPLQLTDLPGSPKRFNHRPIVQRIAPNGSPIISSRTPAPTPTSTSTTIPKSTTQTPLNDRTISPRIISSEDSTSTSPTPRSIPIIIASQRAPIASVNDL
uniref:Laminin G domain-containing protein n=1 Tax=Panagrolaimus sp. PS1159 TaxID=55785 RepID=A0AC35FB20_9BILA